jgi:hypothetical protein
MAIRKKRVSFKFQTSQAAHDVKLCGNFTNWEQGAIIMTRGKSGQWQAQVNLEPGEYEYKYLADGVWHNDPSADRQVANAWGSENSFRRVG